MAVIMRKPVLRGLMLGLVLGLTACAGMPLSTVGYMMTRGASLLEGDPAGMAVAIRHDSRVGLAPGAAPDLQIRIAPKEAGAFPEVNEKLRLTEVEADVRTYGLQAPPPGWRWRVYVFSPQQIAHVRALQAQIQAARKDPKRKQGGSISIGVGMEGLAPGTVAPDSAGIEAWLRMSAADGFRKFWGGTMGEARRSGKT